MFVFVFLYVDVIAFLRILTGFFWLIDTCYMIYLRRLMSYLTDLSFLCLFSVDFEAAFSLFRILSFLSVQSLRVQKQQVFLLEVVS